MTAHRRDPVRVDVVRRACSDDDVTGEWGRCPFQRGANLSTARRARLVADGGGLENRYGVKPIVGSNPTPSALTFTVTSPFRSAARAPSGSTARREGGHRV